MTRKLLTLVAASLLAVTGCTAEGEPPTADEAADVEPVEEPEDDSANEQEDDTPDPGATVEQWASIVAGQSRSVHEAFDSWESDDCLPGDTDPTCTANLLIMRYTADTFRLSLNSGYNPSASTYIGDPPEEIHSLVLDTEELADKSAELMEDAHSSCSDEEEDCLSIAFEAEQHYRNLIDKIDSWAPYGATS